VVTIDDALLLEVPVAHDDASMVLYVQDATASYRARATSALASAVLQQAYFSSLRTEQQLGYVVAMNNRTIRDRGAVTFIIQSPVASPAALEQATIRFMEEQLPRVREMDPTTFEQFKAGLISRLTERAKNLRERSGRYLADLEADVTTFDSQQQIAGIVAGLSRQDVTDYLAETLDRLGTARLLIYSLGRFSDAPAVGRHVDDSPASLPAGF
jgi:secreted Zn-dependent insulinase-like peptidase